MAVEVNIEFGRDDAPLARAFATFTPTLTSSTWKQCLPLQAISRVAKDEEL
jgi:hypothetical protein